MGDEGVWIAERGWYSDVTVEGVYNTREAAMLDNEYPGCEWKEPSPTGSVTNTGEFGKSVWIYRVPIKTAETLHLYPKEAE